MNPRPPRSTLFPYTTLFRSQSAEKSATTNKAAISNNVMTPRLNNLVRFCFRSGSSQPRWISSCSRGSSRSVRSEEHTSELQSQSNLVCRLLLEKKKEEHIRH